MSQLSSLIRRSVRRNRRETPRQRWRRNLILNEAVNHETESIFVAIPKTGTTSVRDQLKPTGTPLIPQPHLDIVQIRDALFGYLTCRAMSGNFSFPTAGVPTTRQVQQQARDIFQSYFKFSAVRNPWARTVSLYARREGVQVRDHLTFEEFCERHLYASDTCRQPTLHKNQSDWLCDEEGRCLMDYVYKVEQFEQAIGDIADLTNGRIVLTHKTLNTNPHSMSRNYRDMYTAKTRDLIARRFERDIDMFQYAF